MRDQRRAHVALAVLLNQVREEEFQGRPHLVAPVVALMEMVLRCSNCLPGGELIPAEEIQASLPLWNGVPLPIRHPREDGEAISARDRDVQDAQVIGHFFDPIFNGGKLSGELWIDIALAKRSDEGTEIIERLEASDNATLEVSTSYFAQREPRSGEHQGEKFEAVQREIVPDHLALLPDEVGACSIEDGCGAPRFNCECGDTKTTANIRARARRPSFQGTETTRWEGPTLSRLIDGWVRQGGERPEARTVDGLPQNVKNWIASKTLLGDPQADNERDLAFFPVVNPGTNRLNRNALRAVLGGRGAQARIPDAAKESAQSMARGLLDREFDEGENMKNTSAVKTALLSLARALRINLGDNMDRDKIIKALCENEACPFEAPQLQDFTDDQLENLAGVYLKENKDGDAGAGDGGKKDPEPQPADKAKEPAENKKDPEPAKDTKDGKAGAPVQLSAEAQKGLEVLGRYGDRLEGFFQQEDRDKAALVKDLAANDQCPFDEKELSVFSLEKLEQLAYALNPADYSARGGPYRPASDDEAVPEAPLVLTGPLEEEKKKKD